MAGFFFSSFQLPNAGNIFAPNQPTTSQINNQLDQLTTHFLDDVGLAHTHKYSAPPPARHPDRTTEDDLPRSKEKSKNSNLTARHPSPGHSSGHHPIHPPRTMLQQARSYPCCVLKNREYHRIGFPSHLASGSCGFFSSSSPFMHPEISRFAHLH